jgi:hypothetical protein
MGLERKFHVNLHDIDGLVSFHRVAIANLANLIIALKTNDLAKFTTARVFP